MDKEQKLEIILDFLAAADVFCASGYLHDDGFTMFSKTVATSAQKLGLDNGLLVGTFERVCEKEKDALRQQGSPYLQEKLVTAIERSLLDADDTFIQFICRFEEPPYVKRLLGIAKSLEIINVEDADKWEKKVRYNIGRCQRKFGLRETTLG